MKRKFAAITFIIIIFCLAAGCSTQGADSQDDGVVNLSLWMPENDAEATKAYNDIIESFNEDYKGEIRASIESIPQGDQYAYENKISAAATSNSLPDLLSVDGPNIANYADSGILTPIDDLVEDKDDFVDSIIKQGTFNNKLYAVGPAESTVALFYNKKMLADAGIHPPTELENAWNWEDFYKAAKKLTNKEKGIYGANWTLDRGEWIIYFSAPFIWSNGGALIADDGSTADGYVNSPEAVEAMQFLQKFTKENLVNLQAPPNEFENGKAAMLLMGSWEWNKLKDYPNTEWGITYFPKSPTTGEVVSPSGDYAWGITSNTEHEEEAAILLNYMHSKENVIKLAEADGKPPARKSSFEEMKSWNEMPLRILKDQVMNTAHPRPRTTVYPVLSQNYAESVWNIFLGNDVQESLDNVAEAVDTEIKRQN